MERPMTIRMRESQPPLFVSVEGMAHAPVARLWIARYLNNTCVCKVLEQLYPYPVSVLRMLLATRQVPRKQINRQKPSI